MKKALYYIVLTSIWCATISMWIYGGLVLAIASIVGTIVFIGLFKLLTYLSE